MEIIQMVIMGLSGLLLIFVGSSRLSNPIKTYANSSGIHLEKSTDLLNEIRGVSAVMLVAGLLMFTGILLSSFAQTSHVVGALVFLGFALGRFISWRADGRPNKKIVQGIGFELVLGGANLFGVLASV